HGRDHPVCNLLDEVAVDVGDVDVARGIHSHPGGVTQFGAGCRNILAELISTARHRGDYPVGDSADAPVEEVGDINVAYGIHGHPRRVVQFGTGGGAVVAAET